MSMGEIRHFSEEHVAAVADLALRTIRGRNEPAGSGLQNCFRDILLQNPWASPDIHSLVYLEQCKVVGFIGIVPRTMEFRGRPIRVAVTTQFMIDRERHRGNAAIELMRQLFRGPQDLSFTDGAGEGAALVWTAAGGRTARLYSLNWTRILRPLGTARSVLDRPGGALPLLKGVARLVTTPVDFLLSQFPVGALRTPQSIYSCRNVSTEQLLECIQEIGWREPLKPVYTQPSFGWLISQAARARMLGTLRTCTVQDQEGARVGWFVYCVKIGGAAYVLQMGARRRDHFSSVLLALFRDAWYMGCSAIKGQVVPRFMTQLTEQHCVFRHPNPSVLAHSRDPDLMNVIQCGDAAITRLDGECWIPFGSES
jgi:hypothetical protein